ncbi:MAG TPA: V-type ATP synthase subunit D [Syntrophorhabdaceae bacterium]|nr:V-type ATP synthase subunit D [Syntrophorhabdaceae bacterium]HOB68191.1 V-type ATP synthase subunit D [Syntrophorhabdaceae bacterium]HOG38971.1 V-type ATP synthase subunit D [Syntrophorhabdaceae bacterium]HQM75720.1 V-type ATP synthase subunit D [Syntrophorhabdaceae bacterium]HQP50864.1 V-type ATP synthase subunit D [Syntrophorhabdaceae bacterium]
MAKLAINPTRMELLRLRKRLVVAQRGHKLLKDKLDGLMKEFINLAKEYRDFRLEVDEELPYVLKLFVLAEVTSSRQITESALESIKQKLTLDVTRRRLMSVAIPKIDVSLGESGGAYSFIHTSFELDVAVKSLKNFMQKLIRMAELEEAVRIISKEIEKTRRRVNALEYTMIPRMLETIKFITSKLDEIERSNTSRLMKIKEIRLSKSIQK